MGRPVDLARVRASLTRLDKLAHQHPRLIQGQGEQWADNLPELENLTSMAQTPPAERQRQWRTRQMEAGRREYRVWLDPADAARLERLLKARGYGPGTKRDGIREILAEALDQLASNGKK